MDRVERIPKLTPQAINTSPRAVATRRDLVGTAKPTKSFVERERGRVRKGFVPYSETRASESLTSSLCVDETRRQSLAILCCWQICTSQFLAGTKAVGEERPSFGGSMKRGRTK